MSTVISVTNVNKSFQVSDQTIPILNSISFVVEKGDFLIIFGPSGCGKSTLLHILLGLEHPTTGELNVLNEAIYHNTTEDDRSLFRRTHIGMVYQQPNWIKSLNVIDNVALPLQLSGIPKSKAIEQAHVLLKEVDMESHAEYRPSELSSGQQQRIALARALVIDPELIIADEPTGNLDYQSGQELMLLLSNLNKNGRTIVMVTHDLEYIQYAKTAIQMLDGRIEATFNQSNIHQLSQRLASKRGVTHVQS